MNNLFSNKNFKRFLTYAILIGLSYYLYFNSHLITETVNALTLPTITIILLLKVVMIAINGEILIITLRCFKTDIARYKSYYITLLSTIGNFLTPFKGGAGVRAIYLKKNYSISYTHFLSILASYYILVFFISSLTGLAGMLLLEFKDSNVYLILIVFFLTVLITSVILLFTNIHKILQQKKTYSSRVLNKIFEYIEKIVIGWEYITKDKRILKSLLFFTLITYIFMLFTTFTEFKALGTEVTLGSMLIYTSLANFSLLVSITPGSLGIREGIFIFFSEILNISNDMIIKTAVIDRSTTLLVIISLYLLLQGLKALPKFKKIDIS